jgi:hypothetical protein
VDIVSRLDSVEVKVTLGKEHVRAALSAFGLTAEEGQERLIYFREDVTPQTSAGTPLLDGHVILRARTWSGDEGDTTVKLRPARQTQLSARVPVQEVEYGDVKEELKGRSSSTRWSVLGPVRAVRWARCRPNPPVPTCRCGPSAGRWAGRTSSSCRSRPSRRRPGRPEEAHRARSFEGVTPERKQQPKTTLVLKKLVEQFLAQPR